MQVSVFNVASALASSSCTYRTGGPDCARAKRLSDDSSYGHPDSVSEPTYSLEYECLGLRESALWSIGLDRIHVECGHDGAGQD